MIRCFLNSCFLTAFIFVVCLFHYWEEDVQHIFAYLNAALNSTGMFTNSKPLLAYIKLLLTLKRSELCREYIRGIYTWHHFLFPTFLHSTGSVSFALLISVSSSIGLQPRELNYSLALQCHTGQTTSLQAIRLMRSNNYLTAKMSCSFVCVTGLGRNPDQQCMMRLPSVMKTTALMTNL